MTDERRYADDEVAEIFDAAAADPPRSRALTPAEGLTLGELQEIGREVGIPPERIAAAASALEGRRGALPRRASLGMPIAVGRTVDLPRAPTDREWEQLVAELRETFRAHGRVGSMGDLRSWTNGNLHANVEPTEEGYRLRLGTLKGDAVAFNRLAMAGIAGSLILAVLFLLTGSLAQDLDVAAIIGAVGAATLVYNAARLPGWALEREEQMEHIAARARALITGTATSEG